MTSAESLSSLDDASLAQSSLVHSFLVDMSLASFSEKSFFSSLKDLIAFIDTYVDFENYAVVIARFKCSEKSIKNIMHKTIIIDSLLHVQNSDVVQSKERSIEAKNRIRRKETFDNFRRPI
jgi:hypothetical protein